MQEVSGVYTSPFLHTDERKMALRAFEKRAPGSGKLFYILNINRGSFQAKTLLLQTPHIIRNSSL